MDATALYLVLGACLVLAGFVGIVIPALPGILLLYGGLFLAAWAEGFQFVGSGTLVVLGMMALVAYAVDFAAGILGAKHFGVSRQAMIGAAIGMFFGLFLGLPGLLLGPFLGAMAGEYLAQRDLFQAGRAGVGTWLGLLVGTAVKLAISVSMLAVFLAARFW